MGKLPKPAALSVRGNPTPVDTVQLSTKVGLQPETQTGRNSTSVIWGELVYLLGQPQADCGVVYPKARPWLYGGSWIS